MFFCQGDPLLLFVPLFRDLSLPCMCLSSGLPFFSSFALICVFQVLQEGVYKLSIFSRVPFADVAIALLCGFVGQFLRLPIIILVRFSVFFGLCLFPLLWLFFSSGTFTLLSLLTVLLFVCFFEIFLPVLPCGLGCQKQQGEQGQDSFSFRLGFVRPVFCQVWVLTNNVMHMRCLTVYSLTFICPLHPSFAQRLLWPLNLSSALDSCSKHGICALLGIEFMCPTFLNMLTI